MKKKKIAIITHNYPNSDDDRQNAGIFVYDLVQELKKYCEVKVFCPGDKNGRNIIGGVEVDWFPWRGDKKLGDLKLWNPLDMLNLVGFFIDGIKAADKFYKENLDFDITVAMWSFPAGLFSYYLKKRYKLPYITWSLGSDIYVYAKYPLLKQMIQKILQNARVLLADGIDLTQKVKNLSGKKCIFLPSASSFKQKDKLNIKKERDKVTFAFLGRIEKVKGPDVLIDGLINIKQIMKKVKVHIIGDGSLLDGLKKKIKNNQLSSSVVFHGNVNDKDKIKNILEISDWLVIPSRNESIPLVFSEAMKVGTPIIVSDLPDLKYLVNKYKIGYIFKSGDSDKLSEILGNIINGKMNRSFNANCKKVAKIFNISQSTQELLKKIKQIT